MKQLLLLVGKGQRAPQATASIPLTSDADMLTALWDDWETQPDAISIPRRLQADLLAIRAEHMVWAYDMGRLPIEKAGSQTQELQEWLCCGEELSMWWCSLIYERHPKMTPNLYIIYKLRCLERLLDAENCSSVRLAGGDPDLRATLAEFCAATGREFSRVADASESAPEKDQPSLARRLYDFCPAPLRALARFAHWWWTVLRPLAASGPAPARSAPEPGSRLAATIATYFPNVDMQAAGRGRFRSRYWEGLHDALNACARREYPQGGHFVRWLFIRFPSPQLTFAQCLKLRNLFRKTGKDGLSFHYLEEFLRAKDLQAALARWLRLAFASRRIENAAAKASHFAGSGLNFWRYIRADWAESFRGWRCLERCLQLRAFAAYAGWCGPQRWTLFPLENCPWERMLTTAMRASGAARLGATAPDAPSLADVSGPVVGAQHSSIRPADFRYFDDPRTFSTQDCALFQPELIEGNGRSACRQWLDAGMPGERLGMVEALRYLYLAEHGKPSRALGGEAASDQVKPDPVETTPGEPVDARSGKSLLLLTSFFRDETEAHLRLFARCWHKKLLTGWNITVKPHPYLPVQALLHELLGPDAVKARISDAPLALALAPGVTVWTANSTTAALEAALKGLPLMVMLAEDDFDLCPLQDVPGLARTATPEDVERFLAAPVAPTLPQEYLDLDAGLPRWRKLLGLGSGQAQDAL